MCAPGRLPWSHPDSTCHAENSTRTTASASSTRKGRQNHEASAAISCSSVSEENRAPVVTTIGYGSVYSDILYFTMQPHSVLALKAAVSSIRMLACWQ